MRASLTIEPIGISAATTVPWLGALQKTEVVLAAIDEQDELFLHVHRRYLSIESML
jgi:hypothetical protein